ncbi:MAG: hypothetical protein U0271_05255 [Polyangiaceae bacterium]
MNLGPLPVLLLTACVVGAGCTTHDAPASTPTPTTTTSASAVGSADSPPTPPAPFMLVSTGERCPRVEDLGDRTLVLVRDDTPTLFTPNQELAIEATEGLPSPRGYAALFTLHPVILEVERQLAPGTALSKPDSQYVEGYYRLDGTRWVRLGGAFTFGEYPTPISLATGSLVATLAYDEKHSSGYDVPAGNTSTAVFVGLDGALRAVSSWPNVLYKGAVGSDDGAWFITIRPGMGGYYLMRMRPEGAPEFFAIPGTKSYRGDELLSWHAEFGDSPIEGSTVNVLVDDAPVRLHTDKGKWETVAPTPDKAYIPVTINAKGAAFTAVAGAIRRVQAGQSDTILLPDATPKSPIFSTAKGEELWVETTPAAGGCALHRLRPSTH